MAVSPQVVRPFESSRSDVPARECVVAWLFGPAANALAAVLVPLRVPPPAVVLVHAGVGLVAAVAVGVEALVAAALLLQLKTLLDNTDGRLARATGRTTLFGRYLDTECDFAVTIAVFVALGAVAVPAWLALAAFPALWLVLSVDFNAAAAYRAAFGLREASLAGSGGVAERVTAAFYRFVFGWQDRVLQNVMHGRLESILRHEHDPARRAEATRAYHDATTLAVLANLGLSTQLAALGVCLALGVPGVYLWLVLVQTVLLPLLQLRRERLARLALSR